MSSRKASGIPFTSSDLREIADRVDAALGGLGDTELTSDDWRWGVTVTITDDMGDDVGQVRAYGDGWLGFYPEGWE